ncbi:hypothetical protein NL676_028258 [Syzygium grande]|nr:hypothetical protein NL676_028258 [Syzygium grande]
MGEISREGGGEVAGQVGGELFSAELCGGGLVRPRPTYENGPGGGPRLPAQGSGGIRARGGVSGRPGGVV